MFGLSLIVRCCLLFCGNFLVLPLISVQGECALFCQKAFYSWGNINASSSIIFLKCCSFHSPPILFALDKRVHLDHNKRGWIDGCTTKWWPAIPVLCVRDRKYLILNSITSPHPITSSWPWEKETGASDGYVHSCIHMCTNAHWEKEMFSVFCSQWSGSEPWRRKNVSKKAGGIKTYLIGLEWEFPWLPSFGPTDADFSHFGKENITKEARVTSEEAFQRRESDRPRLCFA